MPRDPHSSHSPPHTVLQRYFPLDRVSQIQWLGNAGGFSGTQFWRFAADDANWCLRRWPAEHPTIEKLTWIHGVLTHVAVSGVAFLPVPRKLADGRTFCGDAGHLWEVSAWMPGQANYWSEPTDAKLAAAMTGLARFHRASEGLGDRQKGPAPGVVDRANQLGRWRRDESKVSLDNTPHTEIAELARQAMQIMPALYGPCAASLDRAVRIPVDLQPCIRDIWHDHALFVGTTLTAIVDFGAMRIDSVVVDVARLLGSLVEDDQRGWQIGLAAYERVRPLPEEERSLLATIDTANVILSAANWIRWLFVDHRRFEDWQRVQRRIERILGRLRRLAGQAL